MTDNGQNKNTGLTHTQGKSIQRDSFVLEKSIFSNIFEKDIRRVYIYKKAERLAKAIHLIAPAFTQSPSLRNRIDEISIGLIDAAILPPLSARGLLSKELLALSSVLSIARTGSLLSPMNADIITREAQALLQEVATYEEPNLLLEESPSLSVLVQKTSTKRQKNSSEKHESLVRGSRREEGRVSHKGHIKDTPHGDRRETILAVLRSKGDVSIKDISTGIRGVSEKTIQRELQALIEENKVKKTGDRRWSTYSIA